MAIRLIALKSAEGGLVGITEGKREVQLSTPFQDSFSVEMLPRCYENPNICIQRSLEARYYDIIRVARYDYILLEKQTFLGKDPNTNNYRFSVQYLAFSDRTPPTP